MFPAPSPTEMPLAQGVIFNLSTAAPGQESLDVSARFTNDSTNTIQDLDWKIKNTTGEVVFSALGDRAKTQLSPGQYEIEAFYGNAHLDQGVSLPAGTSLSLNFVLKAGALRILPQLQLPVSSTPPSETHIYAKGGFDDGALVATSTQPGEVIKLAAGTYRIETNFINSNVGTRTEIEVKSGMLRSLDITQEAGLAHLKVNAGEDMVEWVLTNDNGDMIPLSGSTIDAVLKPGHYTAQAKLDAQTLSASFDVKAGEEQQINLGN